MENLRDRVEAILEVFDDPRYAHLDLPAWADRATCNRNGRYHYFTVSKFIRVMRDTTAELGLEDGERYVLLAVCACADRATTECGSVEEHAEAVARELQVLATTWVAFLLWPFYAQTEFIRDARYYAKWDECAVGIYKGCDLLVTHSSHFQDEVFRRDDHKCVLSGSRDYKYWKAMQRRHGVPEAPCACFLDIARVFHHPLAFSGPTTDGDEFESTGLTMQFLRRFCQLSDKHDSVAVMNSPENAISLSIMHQGKLDNFAMSFAPTEDPNTYRVRNLMPNFGGFPLPETFTLKNHSRFDDDGWLAPPVSLPSRELFLLQAALAGAMVGSDLETVFSIIIGRAARTLPPELPSPRPNGAWFWKEIVGPDFDVDLDDVVRSFAVEL